LYFVTKAVITGEVNATSLHNFSSSVQVLHTAVMTEELIKYKKQDYKVIYMRLFLF